MDTPGTPTIKAKFDGKVFVPKEPVEFPVGSTVTINFLASNLTLEERANSFSSLIGAIKDSSFDEPEDLPARDVPNID